MWENLQLKLHNILPSIKLNIGSNPKKDNNRKGSKSALLSDKTRLKGGFA